MNIYKTIGQLVVVILICILVNHIMAPKPVEDPFKFADQERLDRMETRLDFDRAIYEKLNNQFDSLSKIKPVNETKIIRIRENRGASNDIISRMSSDELTSILSARYKDSAR